MTLLDLLPGPDPHPELVAVTVPSTRDVLMAVSLMGWLPDERWEPAVTA